MWQIEFEFSKRTDQQSIKLTPGKYTASVELLSTDPTQYRVYNFKPAPDDSTLGSVEDQLLLMRVKKQGLEVYEWLEVFDNSTSELAQIIGNKIEEQMQAVG